MPAAYVQRMTSEVEARPVLELYAGREVALGESTVVRRVLPNLGRRLVGPWCFIDHYGPDDISTTAGMQVAPHPHIGLQTVSWLLKGSVHHRDSIGSDQVIDAGELGLMTAGLGIAHSEQSPAVHPAALHGVQLWVALPDGVRDTAPAWQHVAQLPTFSNGAMKATVFMGELCDVRSPGTTFSPMTGADIVLTGQGEDVLALEPDFEYGVIVMDGAVEIDTATVTVGSFLYLGTGRASLRFGAADGRPARFMLLGGAPFEEKIVMWWNFVTRDTDEIAEAREQWQAGDSRFGVVAGYNDGPVTAAPAMPAGRLKASGGARERKRP